MNQPKQENGLLNLLFNIVIPVFLLKKASVQLGAGWALLIALSFPLGYGLYDLYRRKKWNPLSILGFTNVLVTGSLAVLGLGGIWFSIKEAFFPFLIGLFIWISANRPNPFLRGFLWNANILNTDAIQEKLHSPEKEAAFHRQLQTSTRFLACSFFLSAALNFGLAQKVFLPLDSSLSAEARSLVLNEQIASMTWQSALVIVLPSMIILFAIMWHLLRGIRDLTGLSNDEILKG